MYNTKFVQKLAFAYRNCPLSLETTKHSQTYINSLSWSGIENFPKRAFMTELVDLYWYLFIILFLMLAVFLALQVSALHTGMNVVCIVADGIA